MDEWIKRVTSVFTGTLGALALLSVPTYIWLTRELDRINSDLAQNVNVSSKHSESFDRIESGILEIQDGLNNSIEINNRVGQYSKFSREMTAYLAAQMPNDGNLAVSWLKQALPNQDFEIMIASPKLNLLKAVRYNGVDVLFLNKSDLRFFTRAERSLLIGVEDMGGPALIIWDQDEFPGYVPATKRGGPSFSTSLQPC